MDESASGPDVFDACRTMRVAAEENADCSVIGLVNSGDVVPALADLIRRDGDERVTTAALCALSALLPAKRARQQFYSLLWSPDAIRSGYSLLSRLLATPEADAGAVREVAQGYSRMLLCLRGRARCGQSGEADTLRGTLHSGHITAGRKALIASCLQSRWRVIDAVPLSDLDGPALDAALQVFDDPRPGVGMCGREMEFAAAATPRVPPPLDDCAGAAASPGRVTAARILAKAAGRGTPQRRAELLALGAQRACLEGLCVLSPPLASSAPPPPPPGDPWWQDRATYLFSCLCTLAFMVSGEPDCVASGRSAQGSARKVRRCWWGRTRSSKSSSCCCCSSGGTSGGGGSSKRRA